MLGTNAMFRGRLILPACVIQGRLPVTILAHRFPAPIERRLVLGCGQRVVLDILRRRRAG